MPSVVAVLNQKGGSGKTTIATNLARGLQLEGYRVLIADADPQRTATAWSDLRDGDSDLPPVVGVGASALEQDLDDVGAAYDLIVIDGAPALDSLNVKALKAADVVLIPVRPSGPDVWAGEGLVDLVRTRQDVTGGYPKAAFVVSQQIARTNLAEEIEEVLDAYKLPVLQGRTGQRVAFAEALSGGTTVMDLSGAPKAEEEIREITDDTLALLKSTGRDTNE